MLNFRTFILTVALLLGGALLAWSQEGQDWRYWQNLYHQEQARKSGSEPSSAGQGNSRPLAIKHVDATGTGLVGGKTREACITCHDGLEPMSQSHPVSMGCTVCHGGEAEAVDASTAHSSLIHDPQAGTGRRNPSALSVVHLTCGRSGCHAGHEDPSRNLAHRVRRSMMGSLTGMIAGLRFQWAAQATPQAKYGVYPLPQDSPGKAGDAGTLETEIEALPYFLPRHRQAAVERGEAVGTEKISHHPADGLLRSTCLQCHLDGPPDPEFPRSQGCAACHVAYTKESRYEGNDPTIDKKERGHMQRHRMTALPGMTTCTTCHRGLETERDGNTPPHPTEPPVRDVHVEAGMECIDCHTSSDVMGDGTVYSRQYEAVEIECETCHGDADSNPRVAQVQSSDTRILRESRHYAGKRVQEKDWVVVSRRGRKLSNVRVEQGKIVTVSKRTGKTWDVPLIKGGPAHRIRQHNQRLACNACHSSWVPECKGCHLTIDASGKGKAGLFSSTGIQFREPTLMIGPDDRVRPALPQPPRTLNALDSQDAPLPVIDDMGDRRGRYREFGFTNPRGYSGANPTYATHPHSTGRQVRTCASCHLSAQALGLGEGNLRMGRKSSGKGDRAESIFRGDAFENPGKTFAPPQGTPQGRPVAGSHQPGARAFNQKELNRILRVGNCLPCHEREDDPIYHNIEQSFRIATHKKHRARMQRAKGDL